MTNPPCLIQKVPGAACTPKVCRCAMYAFSLALEAAADGMAESSAWCTSVTYPVTTVRCC